MYQGSFLTCQWNELPTFGWGQVKFAANAAQSFFLAGIDFDRFLVFRVSLTGFFFPFRFNLRFNFFTRFCHHACCVSQNSYLLWKPIASSICRGKVNCGGYFSELSQAFSSVYKWKLNSSCLPLLAIVRY